MKPQQPQQHPLTSEEIIALYPEAQAVLDANRNQRYRNFDDFAHNNFSLEYRKKMIRSTVVWFPIAGSVVILAVWGANRGIDMHVLTAVLVGLILGMAFGQLLSYFYCGHFDERIEERNAALALAAARGEDVERFLPQKYSGILEQLEQPYDPSLLKPANLAQAEKDRAMAEQIARQQAGCSAQKRATFEQVEQMRQEAQAAQQTMRPSAGWKDEDLFI